jgi:hypothetical protein
VSIPASAKLYTFIPVMPIAPCVTPTHQLFDRFAHPSNTTWHFVWKGQEIVLTYGDDVVRGAICFGLRYQHGVGRGRQARKHDTGSLSIA